MAEGLVGYLNRDDAVDYRDMIDTVAFKGCVLCCPAHVTGGFELADGTTASYGVQVELPEP